MSTTLDSQLPHSSEPDGAANTAHSLEVRLPGPLDIPTSLELFRRNGDDLLDRWDGTTLVRTLPVGERKLAYACTVTGTIEEPLLRVTIEDAEDREAIEQALKATFVPAPPELDELLRVDPVIADLNQHYRGLRPVLQFDLLAALVRSISAQQVNLRWAVTTRRRLAETFGDQHRVGEHIVYSLNTERLAAANPADIRALQFTTRKAEYIISVAEAIANGSLSVASLAQLPDEEIIARLSALRGIGRWTAEWILARSLGRPCVVAGDLGVRKAVGFAYTGTPLPLEAEVRQVTAHWGQSAAIAQVLLLHSLSQQTPATGATM